MVNFQVPCIRLVGLKGMALRKPKAVDDGETHPVQIGVEGATTATMARRAPFPPSSILAYIEQSMKLFV
jgi:hypothetical protein